MISEKIAVKDVFYEIKQCTKIIAEISVLFTLIGSLPILLYFNHHQFFPHIEVINLTLIFLYSFIITIINSVFIYGFFCITVLFWKKFLLTKLFLVNSECNNHKEIIFYYYIISFVTQMIAIFCIFLLHKKFNYKNITLILNSVFLITTSILSFILSNKLGPAEKFKTFRKIIIKIFFLLFISTVLFLIIFLMLTQVLPEDKIFNSIICFILSTAITTIPIVLLKTNNFMHALLIWIVLITSILFVTDRFPAIADNIIKNMHLGNYQAEEIYLTSTGCQRIQSTQAVAITSYCSLQNVHVLWNFGDQYFLKLAMRGRPEYLVLDKKQDVLNFPKEAEKIINQPS
ncbi:MAG: hypothetical protein ACMZI2_02490 [Candidatus Symbiodolus clandestinus]